MLSKKSDKGAYHNLLPLDWTTLSFSEKVDYTLKVQHGGFREFILDSDKKLKDYFAKLTEKKDHRLRLYITLFSIPADKYTEESKELLKTFVNTLNSLGRAKLQFLECKNPDMIEIREIR
jgi:hypothetical protein